MAVLTQDTQAGESPSASQGVRALVASALSGTLEVYDFVIFALLADVIGRLFFPPDTPAWFALVQALGIFSIGYLARPLGGLMFSSFADRFGRKQALVLTTFLMSASTLGVALTPTYATLGVGAPLLLILLRLVQGAALGGEIPNAWTFAAEHAPPARVGMTCGVLGSGITAGLAVGTLAMTALNWAFSPQEVADFAWRLPFLIGGIVGLAGLCLRRLLHETPVFARLKESDLTLEKPPLKIILRDHRRGVGLSVAACWIHSGAVLVVGLLTPVLLQKFYGYTALQALAASSVGTFFMFLGKIAGGFIIDRLGIGRFYLFGGLFFGAASFVFYTFAGVSLPLLFALYALAGLSVGIGAATPFVIVNAFPAAVRCTGVSLAYNISVVVFGALTPVLVTALDAFHPMGHAWYVLFVAALACLFGLYLTARGDRIAEDA